MFPSPDPYGCCWLVQRFISPPLQQLELFSDSARADVRAYNEARPGAVGLLEVCDESNSLALTAADDTLRLHRR